MSFENLVGNEPIKQILKNTIKKENILHSYIFYGPSGIGKKEFAKEFAKMILCNTKEENCRTCKSCIEFKTLNHPDFFEITAENDSIKIDEIRKMQNTILEKPIISNNKVYVIDDADTLTKEAQNCLLKTLEEPPAFVTIILITDNDSKLLPTIKSRCSKIVFKKIEDTVLEKFLNEKYGLNIEKNELESYQGSIKNAIKFQENKEIYNQLDKVFSQIEDYNSIDALNNLDILYNSKENINDLLDYITYILYKKIRSHPQYISYIEEIENTKVRLNSNSNYDMCIDRLIFKIWEGNH